jgi:hypothetical protein
MPDVGAKQREATKFIIFSQFEKMNTRLDRRSLPETEAAWMENLQPIAANNLVPTPGPIAALTALTMETVNSMFFANIGTIDYIIVFAVSGAGIAVDTATGLETVFAPDGTFTAPDMTVFASARILIQDPIAGYSQWDGHVFVTGGGVSPNIKVTNGGSNYTSVPTVKINGGSGTGATAHAVLAGKVVISVVLDTAGTGYKAGDTLTVAFSGGGGANAAATAIIWPIQLGTTIAVFAGRVWWANGRVLQFTGTAGYDDTNPTNAAGTTTITDADLSHNITALRTLNNYLYIFGDSSVRQIGSISVVSTITLFTPLILASDIGTSFPLTIASYNRLVLFANKNGVYAIFGASVEKISDDLDGIFSGKINFSFPPSAALNDIRDIHCYLLLVRYIDPIAGERSIICAFQEKKWFITSQGDGLRSIVAAQLAATTQVETYGSSGADITQLLQDPSASVKITLTTALTPHGNQVQAKQPIRAGIGAVMQGVTPLTFSVDNENFSRQYSFTGAAPVTWINNVGGVVNWINNVGGVVTWIGRGFQFPYTDVDGQGKFLGATVTGTVSNSVLNLIAIEYQERALWGPTTLNPPLPPSPPPPPPPPPGPFILDVSKLGGPDVIS